MTYTPEQRAADAEIAKAMGWTQVHFNARDETLMGVPLPEKGTSIYYPPRDGRRWHYEDERLLIEVPRFHESHDAKHSLLVWLAEDGLRWKAFIEHLCETLGVACEAEYDTMVLTTFMTASPDAVAIAADDALEDSP